MSPARLVQYKMSLKGSLVAREAISQFVWEQIKEGATIQQLGAGGGSDRSQ